MYISRCTGAARLVAFEIRKSNAAFQSINASHYCLADGRYVFFGMFAAAFDYYCTHKHGGQITSAVIAFEPPAEPSIQHG